MNPPYQEVGTSSSTSQEVAGALPELLRRARDVLRERAHRLLHASLLRSGVLGLGAKETLQHTSYTARYEGLGHSLYRRVG